MSSFIVSSLTISKIVAGLKKASSIQEFSEQYPRNTHTMLICHSLEERKELAESLFIMNADAVAYRYREPAESVKDFQFSVVPAPEPGALLLHIDCYTYQCNEGRIPQRELYIQLEMFAEKVALFVARNTPEYRGAKWG